MQGTGGTLLHKARKRLRTVPPRYLTLSSCPPSFGGLNIYLAYMRAWFNGTSQTLSQARAQDSAHVPFRDSKLTRLLQVGAGAATADTEISPPTATTRTLS